MKASIDDRECVVSVDGLRCPFELDCRSSTVTVSLPEQVVRIRRPSWKEKRTLAQFAHLGDAFLKREFVRVAVAGDSALPRNDAELEVLWVLARWLNAPEGSRVLPLDHRLLAAVTFDLCAALHLAPSALENLEASDVELLWETSQQRSVEQPISATPGNGVTRIMVVPDPPEPLPGERLELKLAAATAAAPAPDPNPSVEGAQDGRTYVPRLAAVGLAQPAPTPMLPPPSIAEEPVAPTHLAKAKTGHPKKKHAGVGQATMGRGPERFRVFMGGPNTERYPASQLFDAKISQDLLNPAQELERWQGNDPVPLPALRSVERASAPAKPATLLEQHEPDSSARISKTEATALEARERNEVFLPAGRDLAARMPWDEMVDELADRLAGAAVAMGIDVE